MARDDEFDIQHFLPYLLNQAADRSSLEFQRYYKSRYSMLRTEWRVLFHIGRFGGITAKQICDRAGLHKTKVSRAVRALELKRFLTRETQAADRRNETLELTTAGRAAFDELCGAAARFDRDLMAGFTAAEGQVLRQCLVKMARL